MPNHRHNMCKECSHCSVRADSIFNVLSQDEIIALQKAKGHLIYNYGELIFKEGQYPSGMYIVTKGKVKVSKYGFEGREQIMRFAKDGDILGYRALVSEEPYSCSATVVSETHLCFFPGDFIHKSIQNNPDLGKNFIKLLAQDLKCAEEKSLQMAQKTVRERVAESILTLKEVYGFEEDNTTLNINLKRDEIASIAGTVRETATRLLSEFCDDNIIFMDGRKIKILDINRLVKNAKSSF
jgi:CRP/FNR family transcriptional regulator, polysaccharide utilization system transcription regulator